MLYLGHDVCPVEILMIYRTYKNGYYLCSEFRMLHVSLLEVKPCLNLKKSVMLFTTYEKGESLFEYYRIMSVKPRKRCVCHVMQNSALYQSENLRWDDKLMESGNVVRRGGYGRPSVSLGTIEQVKLLFQNNYFLTICNGSLQLDMPRLTFHRTFARRRFPYFAKMFQNLHDINEVDKENRCSFAEHCSSYLE